MFILRIEHSVPDFEVWKKEGFDTDPVDRKGSGVVCYRIFCPTNNPKFVMVDLEFNSQHEAESMLAKLKILWGNVKEKFGWYEEPRAVIAEVLDKKIY